MTTILVVDDDDIVGQTIDRTLRRHNFKSVLAKSGVEALKIARRHPPDLIILDVVMPGMTGYQVCQEVRQDVRLANLPILFLTARGKDRDILQGFLSGADDYLTKPFNVDELILRIQAILRRTQNKPFEPDSHLQVGNARLDIQTCEIGLPHGCYSLTPIQFDLIYHMMIHAGEIFSTHQLLQDIWDYPHDTGSPDLVRVHIRNLRQRIEVDPNAPKYLLTIPGHGYTFSSNNHE